MDAIDFQLLGHLVQQPLASKADLARHVGLGESAVRKRLGTLRDDGVLQGFQASPCADVFGRSGLGLAWDRDVDIQTLLALPDVMYAADSVDGRAGVLGAARDVAAWQADVEDAVGFPADHVAPLPPRQVAPLGPLQWRVMDAMLDAPVASARQLAIQTGLAARTAARVRSELLQGAVDLEPLLRPSRSGAMVYHTYLRGPAAALDEASTVLESVIPVSRFEDSAYLFCHASSMQEQASRMADARRVQGITTCELVLNRDYVFATQRIKGWIAQELAGWQSRP